MLLAAHALCAAKQLKPKARFFCLLLSRKAHASGKITNAFAAAQSHLFYLISPEAARMTVLSIEPTLRPMKSEKKRKGCQGARPGVLPWAVAAIGLT
jgi:hypothetical protein